MREKERNSIGIFKKHTSVAHQAAEELVFAGKLSALKGHDFTGCGNTRYGGRWEFQLLHKASRISRGYSPGGTLPASFTRNIEFLRSLFRRAASTREKELGFSP